MVGLLVVLRTIDWVDVLANKPAFNTLIWFGTLVPLAAGLAQTGVVAWMAKLIDRMLTSLSPVTGLVGLVVVFFLLHYLFASVTTHVTALLPLMLGIATNIHGLPIDKAALARPEPRHHGDPPYGTGPSPVYAGSGYLPGANYWRLGVLFGTLYLAVFLLIGIPSLLYFG